jgi:hypothetical protein
MNTNTPDSSDQPGQPNQPTPVRPKSIAPPAHAQIAALTRYLAQASQAAHLRLANDDQPATGKTAITALDNALNNATQEDATWPPLRSTLRFHQTWGLIHAEAQVEQATQQAPANAGPLNPHRLVLRTLGMMRELSPEYLQQFLSQLDALQWLEQAMPPDKPSAASKSKTSARKR